MVINLMKRFARFVLQAELEVLEGEAILMEMHLKQAYRINDVLTSRVHKLLKKLNEGGKKNGRK